MSNYLIRNYPDFYEYFAELEFTWDMTGGDPIKQPNTNSLLKKNRSVDGIKTGYLDSEKYSLAASVIGEERRLIQHMKDITDLDNLSLIIKDMRTNYGKVKLKAHDL